MYLHMLFHYNLTRILFNILILFFDYQFEYFPIWLFLCMIYSCELPINIIKSWERFFIIYNRDRMFYKVGFLLWKECLNRFYFLNEFPTSTILFWGYMCLCGPLLRKARGQPWVLFIRTTIYLVFWEWLWGVTSVGWLCDKPSRNLPISASQNF